MTYMSPAEQHAQRGYVAKTLEVFEGMLGDERFRAAAGNVACDAQIKQLKQLFVPNVRSGEVIIPTQYRDTEMIPVVALLPDQSVSYSRRTEPTPRQQAVHEAFMAFQNSRSSKDVSGAPDITNQNEDTHAQIMTKGRTAFVHRPRPVRQVGPYRAGFLGRPLMVLAIQDGIGYKAPHVVGHENRHVLQATEDAVENVHPRADADRRNRHELDALDTGFDMRRGMDAIGYTPPPMDIDHQMGLTDYAPGPISLEAFVGAVRSRVNAGRSDLYYPDRAIIDELREGGVKL